MASVNSSFQGVFFFQYFFFSVSTGQEESVRRQEESRPDWFGAQLGGGFKYFLFSTLPGEMIHFDEHIFQMGWFNHQLINVFFRCFFLELRKDLAAQNGPGRKRAQREPWLFCCMIWGDEIRTIAI